MKNITFRIEDDLLPRAKEKAGKEQKSLNSIVQSWLRGWTGKDDQAESTTTCKAPKKEIITS